MQSFPCLLPLLYDLLRWWLLSKGRAGRHGLLGVLLFLILQLDPSAPVIGNRLAELLVLIPYKQPFATSNRGRVHCESG